MSDPHSRKNVLPTRQASEVESARSRSCGPGPHARCRGSLAYKASQDHQRAKLQGAAASSPERFLPPTDDGGDRLKRKLTTAMIAAAKADGHIDAGERARIHDALSRIELIEADRALLAAELDAPLAIDTVAADVRRTEEASEIYIASLLVVDEQSPAEAGYLAILAGRLGLEPDPGRAPSE